MTFVDLKNAEELYLWNKRVLSIGGLWPLKPDYFKFYMLYLYLVFQMIMALSDLADVFGEIGLTIANLSETCVQLMIAVKMLVLRHSATLETVVRRMETRIKTKSYTDQEERNLYLTYMTIGRTFFRIGSYLSLSTTSFYYLRPCESVLIAVLRGKTVPFVLPFRTKLLVNITNIRTWAVIYLSQLPMCYCYYFNSISVCFIFTLVVHVAGELSILAKRIRRMKNNAYPGTNDNDLNATLHGLIIKHEKIISTATAIDDIFNLVLLEELVIFTLLIGLSCYSLLSISIASSMFQYFSILTYVMAFIELIFVYCLAGDYLIQGSANVQDAYYGCKWYEMTSRCQKDIILCMIRAQQPLQLTAGRFYIFSLGQFSGVLKTAMAYMSMLREVN